MFCHPTSSTTAMPSSSRTRARIPTLPRRNVN